MLVELGALLASPLGKLAEWVIGILFIIGMVVGIYFAITHNAAQNQLLKDQLRIQQQVIDNQKEFQAKSDAVAKLQTDSAANLQKQLTEIQDNIDGVNAYLNNPDTIKADKGSSDILKNTIQKLSGEK